MLRMETNKHNVSTSGCLRIGIPHVGISVFFLWQQPKQACAYPAMHLGQPSVEGAGEGSSLTAPLALWFLWGLFC